MSAIHNTGPSNFDAERPLPLGDVDDDAPSFQSLGTELRGLPRLRAPRGPQSALEFAAVWKQIDGERFDAVLAAEERAIRMLLEAIPRLAAPGSLAMPASSEPVPATRPVPALMRVRAAALAMAAALVAAVAIPAIVGSRASASGEGPVEPGLAAETAALSDREVLPVVVVRLAPGSRSELPPLPLRGGP